MPVFIVFILALFFSFIGSIPPGTLNLTVIQLGLAHRIQVAWRFAIAAALIEYPYAWIAVKFEGLITTSPWIVDNIHLLAAVVMIVLGLLDLWPSHRLPKPISNPGDSGFKRGLILSLLNPLAIPYWVGVTAYLKSLHWIDLSSNARLHGYLLGVSLGAFLLLVSLAYLAKKIAAGFIQSPWVKKLPGITLLTLGFYALANYLLK